MATPSQPTDATRNADATSASGSVSPILDVLVVFVVVFALQTITAFAGAMGGLFVLAAPLSADPWTVVTSVYAHDGLGHLLSNGVALVVFGWPVARATTRARFHAFFLATGALAGVSQIVVSSAIVATPLVAGGGIPRVLGASGAIFALLGYLVAANRLSASLASVVDVPRWVTVTVFLGLAAAVTLATAAPRVALIAHFTGFVLGLIAGRARVLHVR